MGDIAAQESVTSNRYTILGRLAGGGMADIFLARVLSEGGVQRHVVLKRVLAERSLDPQFAKMFLDEARLAAQLMHPNIAQLHDIGRLAGSYFYTMEYVHGEDLRAILATLARVGGQLPVNLALLIASGALAALRHAHTRIGADGTPLGVVHRDVSPSNVMISYEGSVKLLDFGVAKAAQHTAESRSGTIKGKIAYLSPEQCQNGRVDPRSDLFSLGIILHEMLVLRRMYRRETDFATMMAIVNEPPPPPSSFRPEISPELDRIVLTALAKDPAQRFSSAGEMLEAIETVAAQERMAMSSTGLGRFLCELVGDRPEPWIELRSKTTEPTVITITGESVPEVATASAHGLGHVPDLGADNALQAQLAAAPALGRQEPRSGDDSEPGSESRSTAVAAPSGPIRAAPSGPIRAVPSGPIRAAPSGPIRTAPSELVGAAPPVSGQIPSPGSPPHPAAPVAPVEAAPSGPIRTSSSGPQRAPGIPSLTSNRKTTPPPFLPPGPPTSPVSATSPTPATAASSASQPFAVRSSTTPPPFAAVPPPPSSSQPFAAVPAPTSSSQPFSAVPLPTGVRGDPTAPVTPIPFVASFGDTARQRRIVMITGGIVVFLVVVIAIAKSGGSQDAKEASDASVNVPILDPPDAAPIASSPVDAPAPTADVTPDAAPRTTGRQLDDAVAAKDWVGGLAICRAEPQLATADRARCAIIACRAKQQAAATAFYAVAEKAARRAIENTCREHGITVVPRRTTSKDPCETNPLTCRK